MIFEDVILEAAKRRAVRALNAEMFAAFRRQELIEAAAEADRGVQGPALCDMRPWGEYIEANWSLGGKVIAEHISRVEGVPVSNRNVAAKYAHIQRDKQRGLNVG